MINTAEIRAGMKRCGYTNGNIARELGITEREVRIIVEGRCIPSWEHLVKIASMLGCAPKQLIISERR